MGRPTQIEIVRRAYELWEQAGKPEGRDQELYHEAERQLQQEQATDEGPQRPPQDT